MNVLTLSNVIQAEKEIMEALEFAREEQSVLHAIMKLSELGTNARHELKDDRARDRIKKLLRGLSKLNIAVRQIGQKEVTL